MVRGGFLSASKGRGSFGLQEWGGTDPELRSQGDVINQKRED